MNTWIIYDSKFGNTEKIAQAITMALHDYSTVHTLPVNKANAFSLVNASDIDMLIVGCPTQTHGISPAMKSFLDKIPPNALRGLPTVCFDTRLNSPRWISGSAAHNLARVLYEKGAYVVVKSESFFVGEAEGPLETGELDRAATWAQAVVTRLAVPQ